MKRNAQWKKNVIFYILSCTETNYEKISVTQYYKFFYIYFCKKIVLKFNVQLVQVQYFAFCFYNLRQYKCKCKSLIHFRISDYDLYKCEKNYKEKKKFKPNKTYKKSISNFFFRKHVFINFKILISFHADVWYT